MESQLYTQWVQTQVPDASQQHNVAPSHEVASRGPEEWSKDRMQNVVSLPVQSPSLASQTLEGLNEFTLGDLSGPSTGSISPTTFFNSSGYSPFNAIPYGAAWPTAPTYIPVSTYSSLNGATTAPSTSQQSQNQQTPSTTQPQQPQSTSTHQMAIDPLLTLNGNSNALQSTFSQSPTYPTIQQQQQSQTQQSQPSMQPRNYQYPQTLLYAPYYRQPTQQQSPQGTLSPQALHSPLMSMIPSNFYTHAQSFLQSQVQQSSSPPVVLSAQSAASSISSGQGETLSSLNPGSASKPAPASVLTPEEKEERKRKFLISIRPLLLSSAFSGAQAVQHLTDRIVDFGITEVEARMRLEILARIRDGAGNHYYRAWSENSLAVEITREWIKAAAKGDSGSLQDTIMPLLHLIDRLPFNLESLAASKLGKVIKNLGKGERSPAIKDMASNLERRWRDMLSTQEESLKEDTKKRKAGDSSTKAGAPAKKAAVGTAGSTKPVVVKKEAKVAVAPVKDAKADSSFFSAPKSKAKLPSFKKALAQVTVKKEDPTTNAISNVSQPSNFDPFQEALKSMKAVRKESPAVSTPPPQGTFNGIDNGNAHMVLKKKKSVSWAPDSRLESIKLIERAVYDDDPTHGMHGLHSSRDLDREEGAALHAHLFEESLDWYDPLLIEMPPDPDPNNPRMPRGHASEERVVQEEREQTALSAVYMTPTQIPDSPAEPSAVLSEEESDKDAKVMLLGDEMDALFYPAADSSMSMNIDSNLNVSQLIGQLSTGISNAMDASSHQAPVLDLSSMAAVHSLRPEQVHQLLSQISSTMGVAGQQQQDQYGHFGSAAGGGNEAASTWASSATPHHFSDYSQMYSDDSDKSRWEDRNGRGGRGLGSRGSRGKTQSDDWGGKPYPSRKSRPCVFFQQQRCKYGDQCDFLHELVPSGDR